MQLLDRYLAAVRRSLPSGHEDDVLAEIGDDLQSQAEAKEAHLGRPLTLDEESAMLKSYGNPRLVASRYGTAHYLIGPTFFPFYWYTLRIVLIIALVTVFFSIAMVPGGPLQSVGYMWGALWTTFFSVVGAVTVIFVVLEYIQRRFGRDVGIGAWNPRKLPPAHGSAVPLSQSIAELVISIAIMLWLLAIPWTRHAIFSFALGPASNEPFALPLQLNPILQQMVLPIFVLYALTAALNIANIIQPERLALRAYVRAAMSGAYCIIALLLVSVRNLITLSSSAHPIGKVVLVAHWLNVTAHWTFAAVAIASLITAYCDLRQLRRSSKRLSVQFTANDVA
ncbi:MAG: hypothetical protein JOZ97_04900 [Candidatus Eremiobacteraeota bacterium]|nr:hypothetical protein [Candidatus Eremiobacteraeota bacterium]